MYSSSSSSNSGTTAASKERLAGGEQPTLNPSRDYTELAATAGQQQSYDYGQRRSSTVEQVLPNYTEQRATVQRVQPPAERAQLQRTLSRTAIEQLQPTGDYAGLRSKERTEYTAQERTPSTAYNPSTDFASKDRPNNPNFVLPSQMRPGAGQPPALQPRPPFAGARPMVGVGPRPPMPPNMVGRGMPPPLRPTDSKSNLLMGPPPPSQLRPGMPPPQLNMQQARLPNSGGPLSPPGQGPPRPPGGFPWAPAGAGVAGGPSGARPPPPQNMTRPPPPTFARPMPGQPLQAPFRPPLYNQQQQQQQQPQHQQQQQQQPQQLRPPSAASVHNENDDDDVVMGQAVTPLKTFNMRNDPMGSPLLEETEPPFDTTSPLSESVPSGRAGTHSKYDPSLNS